MYLGFKIPTLNPSEPDFFIEKFWYQFKYSMYNFYDYVKIPHEHVDSWSTNLNKLKELKSYDKIELYIREYITSYAYDLAKYSPTTYHDDILLTNIKRWDDISKQFNFTKKSEDNKILILFKIFFEFKKDSSGNEICEKLNKLTEIYLEEKPIDIILKTDNYDEIIKWALKNNKPKVLDLLSQIINLEENIKKLFPNFIFFNGTSFIKLCKLFRTLLK